MKKFKLFIVLSLILLGFLSTGCDGSGFFGGEICTQVGCSDGVTIRISEERPDSLSLTIYLNDDTEAFSTTHCTNQDQHCIVEIEEETPENVAIEIEWENGEFNQIFTPEYENFQPNGPDCPPTCRNAFIEIDLSTE